MEEATNLTCIICCSPDCEDFQGLTFHVSGEEDEEDGDNSDKWFFKQFCSQLLSIQSLELERNSSVCSACLDDLTRVVDTKTKVDAVEGRVRKLQRSILMELRELQGCMSTLEEQLKKIKDSVRRSDNGEALSCRQQRMSRMNRGQMKICEEGNDGAVFFRKSISEITTNLHMFCGDLRKRFPNGDLKPKSRRTDQINSGGDTDTRSFKSPSSQPSNDELQNPEVERYDEDDDADVQEIGSGISNSIVLSEDEDPNPVFRSKRRRKLILSDSSDDEDYHKHDRMEKSKSASDKSITRRQNYEGRSTARPLQVRVKASEVLINKLENNSSPIKEAELGLGKCKRASSKKSIVSMKKIPLSDDDHPDEDDDEDDDQNDSDYEPVVAIDKDEEKDDDQNDVDYEPVIDGNPSVQKFKIKLQKNPALEQIDFTGMSKNFRKFVIRCLLNKTIVQIQKPEDDKQLSNTAESYLREAELERMSTMFEYEPELDKLHMKGVAILTNDKEKSVECSKCSYKLNVKWPVKTKKDRQSQWFTKRGKQQLKSHMLNNHNPNVFNCPLCPSSSDSDKTIGYKLETYILHLKTHMNAYPYKCTVCGRPLSSEGSLRSHLRTHMSMEEKEEFDAVNVQPVFMCATASCGKTFRRQKDFKQHQESHLPRELKNLTICAYCGKAVGTVYYKIHRSKYCGDQKGAPRTKCHFCEKTFRNKILMQNHVKRTHSQDARERPYLCHICCSTFKIKWDLTHHMKIHAEERIYKCDKGCGRDFATKGIAKGIRTIVKGC